MAAGRAAAEQSLGVCAVDAAEAAEALGAVLVGAGPAPERPEGAWRAVRGLQAAGFNVILVAGSGPGGGCGGIGGEEEGHAWGVDTGRLLRVRAACMDGLEVVRLAEEYGCPFASNRELGEGVDVPWTLPGRQRKWLRRSGQELQVRFRFAPDRTFVPQLPPAVARHLARGSGCGSGGGAGGPERHGSFRQEAEERREQPLQPAGALQAVRREPPAPPCAVAETLWEPTAGVDLGVDGLEACVLAVQRGTRTEYLLCTWCDDPCVGLFNVAGSLAVDLLCVGSEALSEADGGDPELGAALSAMGGIWVDCYVLVTVASGRHAGLRAVGLGSNLRKRRRAAHLALAATAALSSPGPLAPELAGLARAARRGLELLGRGVARPWPTLAAGAWGGGAALPTPAAGAPPSCAAVAAAAAARAEDEGPFGLPVE